MSDKEIMWEATKELKPATTREQFDAWWDEFLSLKEKAEKLKAMGISIHPTFGTKSPGTHLTDDQINALCRLYRAASDMPMANDPESQKLRNALKEVRDAGYFITFPKPGSLGAEIPYADGSFVKADGTVCMIEGERQ